jgi:hypothetical protein
MLFSQSPVLANGRRYRLRVFVARKKFRGN